MGTCLRRDLNNKGLGQNKVMCSSFGSRTANGQLPCRLPDASYARKIDLWLLAGFWLLNRTDSDSSLSPFLYCLFFVASSLSPHLARFLVRFVGRPRFYFRESVGLTVGLAIGGAESRGIDVAVNFFGWSL